MTGMRPSIKDGDTVTNIDGESGLVVRYVNAYLVIVKIDGGLNSYRAEELNNKSFKINKKLKGTSYIGQNDERWTIVSADQQKDKVSVKTDCGKRKSLKLSKFLMSEIKGLKMGSGIYKIGYRDYHDIYGEYEIIENHHDRSYTIRFDDTGSEARVFATNIYTSSLFDHMFPVIFDVGFYGDTCRKDTYIRTIYNRWYKMLYYCYGDGLKISTDRTMVPEWHNFTVFKKWYMNMYEHHDIGSLNDTKDWCFPRGLRFVIEGDHYSPATYYPKGYSPYLGTKDKEGTDG